MWKVARMITLLAFLVAWTAGARAELQPGMVLNQDTWQQAEGLLPPEILAHYKNGEYANVIAEWPIGLLQFPPDFKAASEKNASQLDVDDNGTIIEKSTNKQPPYILGFPFPIIDPADPKAGAKVVWNYFYRTFYFGSLSAQTQLNWVAPRTLDRRADVMAHFEHYDGIPSDERLPNPDNFIVRILATTVSPADLNGTAALTWRYRDSIKRDSSWAYVPALRRVRAVSPANRSDGFLGSDMSQDDGQFFDGKPEDFTWALRGESDQLRLVDPLSLKGEAQQVWQSSGGWRNDWPDLRFVGYLDQTWKGVVQCAESIKRNQATVAGIKSNPKADFDYRVKFPSTYFDMNSLARTGK
jgi:hypothetical protein